MEVGAAPVQMALCGHGSAAVGRADPSKPGEGDRACGAGRGGDKEDWSGEGRRRREELTGWKEKEKGPDWVGGRDE